MSNWKKLSFQKILLSPKDSVLMMNGKLIRMSENSLKWWKKYQMKDGLCWIISLVIICHPLMSYSPITKTTVTSIHWPVPKKYPNQTKIFKKASQAATRKSQEKTRRQDSKSVSMVPSRRCLLLPLSFPSYCHHRIRNVLHGHSLVAAAPPWANDE